MLLQLHHFTADALEEERGDLKAWFLFCLNPREVQGW